MARDDPSSTPLLRRVGGFRIAALALLARWLYRFLHASLRPVISTSDDTRALEQVFTESQRVIVAFWHDRLGMIQLGYSGPGLCTLVSLHADGEIIARAVGPLGIRAARGSASRGSVGGMRGMVRAFREGLDLAVAVDGPRGPRHRVKVGVLQLARATGAPVFPTTCAPKRRIVFRKSWDQFVLPFPFTRVHFVAGPPVWVAPDASEADLERKRVALENDLIRLTAEVERLASGGV